LFSSRNFGFLRLQSRKTLAFLKDYLFFSLRSHTPVFFNKGQLQNTRMRTAVFFCAACGFTGRSPMEPFCTTNHQPPSGSSGLIAEQPKPEPRTERSRRQFRRSRHFTKRPAQNPFHTKSSAKFQPPPDQTYTKTCAEDEVKRKTQAPAHIRHLHTPVFFNVRCY